MNIGLIAHDSKKALMQNFCIAYRGILSKHSLYATGTTGRLIEEVTNLKVHKYLAGPLGGKQQLGAQIAQNDIDALIFLREPSNPSDMYASSGFLFRLHKIHRVISYHCHCLYTVPDSDNRNYKDRQKENPAA